MSLKLKALGFSLLAAMAISAVAVMNAAANPKDPSNQSELGHFVSDINHTNVVGSEGPGEAHNLHLTNHGLSGQVGCDEDSYTATAIGGQETKFSTPEGHKTFVHGANTVSELLVTPEYGTCYTTTQEKPAVTVHVNGCKYRFTVAKGTTSKTEQTVHLECPTGQAIKVTHPNCTVTIHPQTINTGVTYVHVTNATTGKNEVTLESNAQFNTTRHGLCQFIAPTNGLGTLTGSATVKGVEPGTGNQVNITAT